MNHNDLDDLNKFWKKMKKKKFPKNLQKKKLFKQENKICLKKWFNSIILVCKCVWIGLDWIESKNKWNWIDFKISIVVKLWIEVASWIQIIDHFLFQTLFRKFCLNFLFTSGSDDNVFEHRSIVMIHNWMN